MQEATQHMAVITKAHLNDCRRNVKDTFCICLRFYIFLFIVSLFYFYFYKGSLMIKYGASSRMSLRGKDTITSFVMRLVALILLSDVYNTFVLHSVS